MGYDSGVPVLAAWLRKSAATGVRLALLAILSGTGCMALGLAYVLHAFGPTEAEVVRWGEASICMGFALLLTTRVGCSRSRVTRSIASLGFVIVALLQVPPTLLWFAFHGTGISDGTPPSAFVAHWAYSLPHLALLVTSGAILYGLWARPQLGSRTPSRLQP